MRNPSRRLQNPRPSLFPPPKFILQSRSRRKPRLLFPSRRACLPIIPLPCRATWRKKQNPISLCHPPYWARQGSLQFRPQHLQNSSARESSRSINRQGPKSSRPRPSSRFLFPPSSFRFRFRRQLLFRLRLRCRSKCRQRRCFPRPRSSSLQLRQNLFTSRPNRLPLQSQPQCKNRFTFCQSLPLLRLPLQNRLPRKNRFQFHSSRLSSCHNLLLSKFLRQNLSRFQNR